MRSIAGSPMHSFMNRLRSNARPCSSGVAAAKADLAEPVARQAAEEELEHEDAQGLDGIVHGVAEEWPRVPGLGVIVPAGRMREQRGGELRRWD